MIDFVPADALVWVVLLAYAVFGLPLVWFCIACLDEVWPVLKDDDDQA